MGKNELLTKLGLGDRPGVVVGVSTLVDTTPFDHKYKLGPVSDTALVLDKWDLERGRELEGKLCAARGQPLCLPGDEDDSKALADFHGACFNGDPQLAEQSSARRRHEYLKTLMETPDYQTLHNSTAYNGLASEMAATEFADQYAGLTREDAKREKLLGDNPSPKKQERAARQAEAGLLRAAGKALSQAQQTVDDLNDQETSLSAGLGQGTDGTLNTEAVAQRFKQIRDNPTLRSIINKAGRYRMFAQGRQRQKVKHGQEELIGVCLDDRVDRLLDEELAGLCDPDLELDTLRRLSERETLAHDYRGEEKVGLGPIVVCVDESGSMSGQPVEDAKAFALAMYWVAQHQKRHCVLVGYSGGRDGTFCVLPPGKPRQGELLDWLAHFYGGGTVLDVPLDVLPGRWDALGLPAGKKTDVVLITDAVVSLPPAMRDAFLKWKQAQKAKVYTLLVGGYGQPGDLEAVSDEWFNVAKIGLDNAGVQKCLSV